MSVASPGSPYRRPVSANEKMYMAGAQLSPPFCIQALIEGHGALDVGALQRAVKQAADANPGCRLRVRGSAFSSHWEETGLSPLVHELTGPWHDHDLAKIPALTRRLDAYTGPTCEVLVLPGETTRLLFRAFHGVMDAQGVAHWMDDVFRALREQALVGSHSALTDLELARSLKCEDTRPNFPFDCGGITGPVRGQDTGFVWRRFQIPGQYPGLVSKLAVVLAQESRRHHPGMPVRFMVPVDLRSHLPAGVHGTGNLSNPLFISPEPQDSWVDVYQHVIDSLDRKREGMIGSFDHVMSYAPVALFRGVFKLLARRQFQKNRFMATAVISNIGKVDLDKLSAASFRAHTVNFLPFDIPISPMTLVTVENEHHVECSVSMPSYLANEGRLDQLIQTLIQQLTAPAELEKAAAAKHAAMVAQFNNTATPVDNDRSLFDFIQEHAQQSPDAPALRDQDHVITFGQLLQQVALDRHRLAHAGVNPGDRVGMLLHRSPAMVTHILALLSLGASYVPVDPSYPSERRLYILHDAGIEVLITQQALADSTPFKGAMVMVDQPSASSPDGALQDPQPWDPNALAYVIYTSGSTGQPKGVEIERRQLMHYVRWAAKVYANNEPCSFPLFSSLAFDLTVTSIFVPLITGGTIEVIAETEPMQALQQIFNRDQVDIIKMTPSHMRLLAELPLSSQRLKGMVVGGEDLPVSLCLDIEEKFGSHVAIFNEYGPTEATVGCMIHRFDRSRDNGASVPIGVPADNTELLILNAQLQAIDADGKGELFIGGSGLARGYLNRPELTQERFIEHPFKAGQKLYRTGDLVGWHPSGVMNYFGRMDDQVKVSGFRVELGEIQRQLQTLPGIDDAVVLAHKGPLGTSLHAFVTRSAEVMSLPAPHELLQQLSHQIPPWMVPQTLKEIEALPLTVNGKVDSSVLHRLIQTGTSASSEAQPMSDKQAWLRQVWAELLQCQLNDIDEQSNFYELGGDSLRMAMLLRRIRTQTLSTQQQPHFARKVPEILASPVFQRVHLSLLGD